MEVELLPAERQLLWGRLAVANFFFGGAGAGAYVVAAILWGFERAPSLALAGVLGPALVAVGFLCVAAEAGRPLRGPRVLRMVGSSWMSRELWAGGAFIACAAADLASPWIGLRVLATLAALALILAQGWILHRARGVAAWNVSLMPVVFFTSGLLGGAGLLGIAAAGLGGVGGARLAWATAALTLLDGATWLAYLGWPGDPTFRRAIAPLRRGAALAGVLGAGHLLPLLFLASRIWEPEIAAMALALSGIAILVGGLVAKGGLVLRTGQLRPITLPRLAVRLSASR